MSHTRRTDNHVTNLLWTGGWDSTFRLLYVLLVLRRRVATYYVINVDRAAWINEIRTIHRIKDYLRTHNPDAFALLEPTRIYSKSDLRPSEEIANAYKSIRAAMFLGPQYRWLAQFASEVGVDFLELAIHRDDKAHSVLAPMVNEQLDDQGVGTGSWALPASFSHGPEHALFGRFVFPLFGITKIQMAEIATEHGFGWLLECTSFCHAPLSGGQPCGTCNPCTYTIEEGLGRRLGRIGRTRYFIKKGCRGIPIADGILGAFSAVQRKMLGSGSL